MSDELKSCPFCGDPMTVNAGIAQHVHQTADCPIAAIGFPIETAERWNTRSEPANAALVEQGYRVLNELETIAHLKSVDWTGLQRIIKGWRDALKALTATAPDMGKKQPSLPASPEQGNETPVSLHDSGTCKGDAAALSLIEDAFRKGFEAGDFAGGGNADSSAIEQAWKFYSAFVDAAPDAAPAAPEVGQQAVHNAIGDFFFDEPDFDDAGGRTFRRIKVPKDVVRSICQNAIALHVERAAAKDVG